MHFSLVRLPLPIQTTATPTPNFCIWRKWLFSFTGSIDSILGKIKIIVLISQINTFFQFSSSWSVKIILPDSVQQKISCLHLREYHAFQFKINPPNFWSQLAILTSPLLDRPVTHYQNIESKAQNRLKIRLKRVQNATHFNLLWFLPICDFNLVCWSPSRSIAPHPAIRKLKVQPEIVLMHKIVQKIVLSCGIWSYL